MASKSAQVALLQRLPIFEGCSKRELHAIQKAGSELSITAGTLLIDQGQMGREAFVLLEGSVTVRRNGRKVTTLDAGSIIGELSLLDHGPRAASVICDTDCLLFVLDQSDFRSVIEHQPGLALKLLATFAARIREVDRAAYG